MSPADYMYRALELARLGKGYVSPNPMVGCVIVNNSEVIGEGWHQKYGGEHAEVIALKSVKNKAMLKDSIVYVSLEPCSHHGKTPPCADQLIKEGVKKVVIGNLDPNPLVSGKGIAKLLKSGIQVETGILEQEARLINLSFFTFYEKKRPYIILKWAQTADGFLAKDNFDSKWISNSLSRKIVHKWRAEEDAILVGTNTVLCDNPRLNVRDWQGDDPLRVFIDKKLKLARDLNVYDGSQETICYTNTAGLNHNSVEYVQLDNESFVQHVFDDLYGKKIMSVIVEGGAKLLNSLIKLDLWDEARVFKSNVRFDKGISAPVMSKNTLTEQHEMLSDVLFIYKNN